MKRALRRALRQKGLEGLIERYPEEWERAQRVGGMATPWEIRTKMVVERFLMLVERRLEEDEGIDPDPPGVGI